MSNRDWNSDQAIGEAVQRRWALDEVERLRTENERLRAALTGMLAVVQAAERRGWKHEMLTAIEDAARTAMAALESSKDGGA